MSTIIFTKKNIVLSSSSVSGVKYLIYTTPMEIILVRTKISVVFSFMILLPLIIYFLINPIDLLKKFKHLYAISIIAVILFYCGIALTFNVFIPIILKFLLNYETNYLLAFWTLRNYTDLIINTCILFGCLCELPLILNVLILSNIVNLEKIIFAKKYIIVFIFVLAAAITPGPDAIAQLVVAVPLWIFFELNLMILKIVYKTKKIKIE
ncbi:twin-arginine translocase subunit TatC [Candidatus Poribacteria bacterium]|nr:twin-arginine translocase subunit TatC [Candidatus Poribacteria bacterium]